MITTSNNLGEKRRTYLVSELKKYGFFRMKTLKQPDELTLPDLERMYIRVKCNIGKILGNEQLM